MFLDHFEVLISRINFIKIKNIYIFNIFSNKKNFKIQSLSHFQI
jgi:hypothetical protein